MSCMCECGGHVGMLLFCAGRGDAALLCGPWGRGCTEAHTALNLPPPLESSLKVAPNCSCPVGSGPLAQHKPCCWNCKCPSLSSHNGSGIINSEKERTAMCVSRFLPCETLCSHSLFLSSPHLETGRDPHLTCDNAEDQQSGKTV